MKQKGFSLIELLVVVAIIAILAAVGIVAYNGYTKSAKKSACKSNNKSVCNYVMAEFQKCYMGEKYILNNNYECANRFNPNVNVAGDLSKAIVADLADNFKNPYGNVDSKIGETGIRWGYRCSSEGLGYTMVQYHGGNKVAIRTCNELDDSSRCTGCNWDANPVPEHISACDIEMDN
jgi:type IV pilus assembly protein PilA